MICRKAALALLSVKTTVYLSGILTPLTSLALPSVNSFTPAMSPKNPAPGLWVLGLSVRSNEYLTSAAVTSRPLWNFTPRRSLNVYVLPSEETVNDSAKWGTSVVVPGS